MRVLIADDDPVYQALLENLLTEWGYDPIVAADGDQAWEALAAADRPTLALLDWMMPGTDGFELCRRIRQADWGEDLYVVLLTGSQQKQEIIKVLVAGADDYLIKPFEPLDLKIHLLAARRIIQLRDEVAALRQLVPANATVIS